MLIIVLTSCMQAPELLALTIVENKVVIMTSQSSDSAREILQRIIANVETVILGQKSAIEKSLLAMLSGGHVLLEDYPGTGKTTLSKALALSIEAKYKRIQFTPDLLPSEYNRRVDIRPTEPKISFP